MSYQAVGIGNAVMDVISQCDDAFLQQNGIGKGVMQLIGQDRAEALYAAMPARYQMAGGSVANTIAGLAALGLGTGFIGRVAGDEVGRDYAGAMTKLGCDFVNAPRDEAELPSSRSMIFVTPDGERSMNTYLGVSTELDGSDVPEAVTGATGLLLLEGYLYDKPKGKAAFSAAAHDCRAGGGMAGITLSDPFCVERHRADFRKLAGALDFVIGNEHEWQALYEAELEAALAEAALACPLIICTRAENDVMIIGGGARVSVPVAPVIPVDATGAGDQFAAGFLYGLVQGRTLEAAGRMGCIAAAEVIGHYGARPEVDVMELFKAEGLA